MAGVDREGGRDPGASGRGAAPPNHGGRGRCRVAERDVDAARIEQQQAQDDLDNCAIAVPPNGPGLRGRKVRRAERARGAGQECFSLIDVSKVRVAFGVPDSAGGPPGVGPGVAGRGGIAGRAEVHRSGEQDFAGGRSADAHVPGRGDD